MFHLTVLLEHMTALLEYIDLFILDVVNVFQHEYCTSNQDLQYIRAKAKSSELHPAVTLQYDCNFLNNKLIYYNLC